MVKWCNIVTKCAFTLVWCYGEMNMVKWCIEYTQTHMVKWWNTVVKLWNGVTINTFISSWWNVVTNMVRLCTVYTISHGEKVKHSSGDILTTKFLNGETVIFMSVSPIFHPPPPPRQWGPIRLIESIGFCICCL